MRMKKRDSSRRKKRHFYGTLLVLLQSALQKLNLFGGRALVVVGLSKAGATELLVDSRFGCVPVENCLLR